MPPPPSPVLEKKCQKKCGHESHGVNYPHGSVALGVQGMLYVKAYGIAGGSCGCNLDPTARQAACGLRTDRAAVWPTCSILSEILPREVERGRGMPITTPFLVFFGWE